MSGSRHLDRLTDRGITSVVHVTDPHENFFRRSAIEHYLAADERGEVIRISPPWTWSLLAVMAVTLGAALLLSIFSRIETTDRGPGILRPLGGVRTLIAQVGSVVTHVAAKSGDRVEKGGIVLRLASAGLEADLFRAEREVQLLRSDSKGHLEFQARMYDEQEAFLRTRLAMLQEMIASQEQSLQTFERRLERSEGLEKSGLISAASTDDARESLSQSRRTLSASRENLAQSRQELSALQSRRQAELWQRQETVQSAQNRREGLALLLRQTEIRAPVIGDVEAVNVKVGDVVQAGQSVARLVPREVDYQVTSLLPEKDRAFVKAGDDVKLELDQFPYTEFGTLDGRILRVGDDLASSQEIREAFGDDHKVSGATYRVDIEILKSSSSRQQQVPLRSGMLMSVRYTLRRERPILLFFTPLRRWLNE